MSAFLPEAIPAGPVVLRRRHVSDVQELLVAIEASIDELGAFLRWAAGGVPSRAELERTVTAGDAAFEAGTGFEYVLRDATTGEVVGEAGGELRTPDAVELGYWVRSDRTGRGYARAAARALTSAVFDAVPKVQHVELRMDHGNGASRAVAERLGFAHVGVERFTGARLPGQTGAGHIYAMMRVDWDAGARSGAPEAPP
jgi:RimJ/RimL family protein N-acetyltransferase